MTSICYTSCQRNFYRGWEWKVEGQQWQCILSLALQGSSWTRILLYTSPSLHWVKSSPEQNLAVSGTWRKTGGALSSMTPSFWLFFHFSSGGREVAAPSWHLDLGTYQEGPAAGTEQVEGVPGVVQLSQHDLGVLMGLSGDRNLPWNTRAESQSMSIFSTNTAHESRAS